MEIKPNHYYRLNTGVVVKVMTLSQGGTSAFCQYVIPGERELSPNLEKHLKKGPYYTQVDINAIREEVNKCVQHARGLQ
jgi:hypothetical protein